MATVLIVDDDQQVRSFLLAILTPEHEVVQAAEPDQAVELARLTRPDLVLLDLHLQGHQDGLEVCRTLRHDLDPTMAQVPILMVTEADSKTDVFTALAAGASSYLSKPYQPAVLLELIDTVLGWESATRLKGIGPSQTAPYIPI